MDRQHFLKEVESLPVSERLALAQDLLISVQKELAHDKRGKSSKEERDRRWAAAAEKALPDYLPGGDLELPDTMDDYDYEDE